MEQTENIQPPISEINNDSSIVKQPNITKIKLFLVLISVFVLATVLVVFTGVGGGKTVEVVNAPATNIVVDDMSGWKTYTNDEYGFSFKYPPTYSIKTENPPDPFAVAVSLESAELNLSIFEIFPIPEDADLKQWPNLVGLVDYNPSQTRDISLGAYEVHNWKSRLDENKFYYLYRKNSAQVLLLAVKYNNTSNPTQEGVISQILSTFKFVEG